MIALAHDVPAQEETTVLTNVEEERHLRRDGHPITAPDQGGKRMLSDEIEYRLFVSFLEVRQVIHAAMMHSEREKGECVATQVRMPLAWFLVRRSC